MKAVVTGAAGFIGSRLVEGLLEDGHDVVGVDCFTDAYPTETKRRNVEGVLNNPRFRLAELDLRTANLTAPFENMEVLFHLAALPGVRASWEDGFGAYVEHNILATQRLLEIVRHTEARLVYASSSSVYGNSDRYPVRETDHLRPSSPYGVSKASGEQLCLAYAEQFGLHAVVLRYFSVYGPRQRPDMGIHKLIDASLRGLPFTVFGDGQQIRETTYVDDVVNATQLASEAHVPSQTVFNIAGGSEVSITDLIDRVSELAGRSIEVRFGDSHPGDVRRTGGDIALARSILPWEPAVSLDDGLASQFLWQKSMVPVGEGSSR